MNNEKTLDGALCAGGGTADAAGAASAESKKKYVPPTMQVIPLGPQRMLATSQPDLSPLKLTITGMVDFYDSIIPGEPGEFCSRGGTQRMTVGCNDFLNNFQDVRDPRAEKAGFYWCYTANERTYFSTEDGPIWLSSSDELKLDCPSSRFRLNEEFPNPMTVTGTLNGRPVEAELYFYLG